MAKNHVTAYHISTNHIVSFTFKSLEAPMTEQIYESSKQRLVLLTAREAASYLRVSLSTLHRMERRGALTPLRTPGGHRRYTLDMLNDCLSFSDDDLDNADD